MALDDHPNVFRYEGKRWVSELPAAEAAAQFDAKRKWDATYLKSQHWTLSLVLGAIAGTIVTFALGAWGGIAPVFNLVLLPLGFAAGAVLGAAINKRILGDRLTDAPDTPRPETVTFTRIPFGVARKTDETTSVEDLVTWSNRGFV